MAQFMVSDTRIYAGLPVVSATRRLSSPLTMTAPTRLQVRPVSTEVFANAPVMIDEIPSITALAVSTLSRADETPVRSDTTTKMLSGTRNSDDSCEIELISRQLQQQSSGYPLSHDAHSR